MHLHSLHAAGARPLRYTLSYLRTPNTSPFLLDDVQCTGEEESLLNCSHAGLMNHDCYPSEQVGTLCERKATASCTTHTHAHTMLIM